MVSTKSLLAGVCATLLALQVTAQASADSSGQFKKASELTDTPVASAPPAATVAAVARDATPDPTAAAKPAAGETAAPVEPSAALEPQGESAAAHEHMIQLPGGGPALKIRGFFDFNFGLGSNSNPLIFPLPPESRSTFQAGEFDLFFSSKLSRTLSFVGEVVIGTDQTNAWGLDVERYQLTYRPNKYFEISGGRYHTAIGYYNTAFHHGLWFQTAAGRPFMYFFEDSGGLLPVHQVGVTTTGLVPGPETLGLHWIVEVGNGRSSDPALQPVQNFESDKTTKALNFAAFIKPSRAPGLQIGGSYYIDRMYPPGIGLARVDQRIAGAYAVYNNSLWEFMAEGVLLSNTIYGTSRSYNSPLSYAQIARKFGSYRPYVRFQYVNSIVGDPVNVFVGRYDGPSIGMRKDVSDYAALKLQYNLLRQRSIANSNGLLAQLAFTF